MILNKYRLGDLIEMCIKKNSQELYSLSDVKGISIKKEFIETKADMKGVSLKPYLIVEPDSFAYVPITSRNGEKITIAHNDTDNVYIVSSSYIVFKIKRKDLLDSNYLFMFFNRSEFDRYARFNSWGSAREAFSWNDMCDIDIILPNIEEQKKYSSIYKSMKQNQISCEKRLNDLKFVCDTYIEGIRKETPQMIGNHIIEYAEKNIDLKAKKEMGVSINKMFFPTKASASNIKNQKIVYTKTFAYNTNTSRNSDTISIALNDSQEPYAVSNTYCVFKTDESLIPEYLLLWFKRKEFDRYARFNSWGSARETIDIKEIQEAIISIPDLEKQNGIINVFKSYMNYYNINEKLKEKIKDMCSLLIVGSIQ